MRDILPEWYSLGADDVRDVVLYGTIALDANVLLDLYRLGAGEREQILEVFSKDGVRERLWVPFQAAVEYQRNRVNVTNGHVKQYDDICDALTKSIGSVLAEVEKLRDKSVKDVLANIVHECLTPAVGNVSTEVQRLQSLNTIRLDHSGTEDKIRMSIDSLFADTGQIGSGPDSETVAQWMKTVDDRYSKKIPPGYKDASKNEGREGDLFVWYELLNHAEKADRPVLFITSDIKEDWYERIGGKTAGPRRELRVEMMQRTSHPYHQVSLDRFLQLANDFLSARVESTTIQVVDEISRQRQLESKFLSQLRHPGVAASIEQSLDRLPIDSDAYMTINLAQEMLNGSVPFDLEVATEALSLLRSEQTRRIAHKKRSKELRRLFRESPADVFRILGSDAGDSSDYRNIIKFLQEDPSRLKIFTDDLAQMELDGNLPHQVNGTVGVNQIASEGGQVGTVFPQPE